MAVRGVRRQQEGRRGQLPEGARRWCPSSRSASARAKREAPISGAIVPNFFRKPFGPGWALVGDAGYNKDPITAQGITDAFRDAERCVDRARRAHVWRTRPFDAAMADYQRERDEHVLPMYEFTCQLATLEPPPPRDAAAVRRDRRQPEGDGRLRPDERRHDFAGGSSSLPRTSARSWPPRSRHVRSRCTRIASAPGGSGSLKSSAGVGYFSLRPMPMTEAERQQQAENATPPKDLTRLNLDVDPPKRPRT